jgi:hypothetical protein
MVKDKPKYKLLLPRYRDILIEIRELKRKEEEAYTSDLDIDLTNLDEIDVKELKINF